MQIPHVSEREGGGQAPSFGVMFHAQDHTVSLWQGTRLTYMHVALGSQIVELGRLSLVQDRHLWVIATVRKCMHKTNKNGFPAYHVVQIRDVSVVGVERELGSLRETGQGINRALEKVLNASLLRTEIISTRASFPRFECWKGIASVGVGSTWLKEEARRLMP